jgi:hypothetical protein
MRSTPKRTIIVRHTMIERARRASARATSERSLSLFLSLSRARNLLFSRARRHAYYCIRRAAEDKEEEVASAGDDPVRQGERVVHHIPRTGHKALVHDTPHPLCLALYSKGTNTCHGRQDAHDDDDGRNPTTCQLSHE